MWMLSVVVLFLFDQCCSLTSCTEESSNVKYWYPYCNKNPSQYDIEPLPSSDISRIDSLSQLHVIIRHGARVASGPISYYFPTATDAKFICNITTIETRDLNFNSDLNNNFVSIRKNYVPNEEYIEGNCLNSQSLNDLIMQHTTNAKLIQKTYFQNNNKNSKNSKNNKNGENIKTNLWSKNKLFSIGNNIDLRKKQGNQEWIDLKSQNMYVESTDYERTLASAIVFMSQLLDIHDSSVIFDINVHDSESDPWNPDSNYLCKNAQNWFFEYTEQSNEYIDLWNSDWRYRTAKEWTNATNSSFSSMIGITTLAIYCVGNINIPLFCGNNNMLIYNNTVNFSYAIKNAIYHNSDKSTFAAKLMSAPLSYDLLKQINALTLLPNENKNNNKNNCTDTEDCFEFLLHSTHDNTIMYFLEAFGIFDGVQPIFAEMITLEIYLKANEKNSYLFRWIRNGKFLPFPKCDYSNQTQLCDLQVLLDTLQSIAMPLQEWQPYCQNITQSAT